MKKIIFSILFKKRVKKVKKISRINKKNLVYYCELENGCYAIKVYRNKYNGISRFNNELYWLEKLKKENFVKTPKVYLSKKMFFWNILVIQWFEGVSIKKQIDNDDSELWLENIYDCLTVLEKIWAYNIDIDKIIDDSFDYKCGTSIECIIKKIKHKKKGLEYYYDTLLSIYKSIQSSISFKKNLINSDISLHEFLLCDKEMALLDYEYFCIGDINNDLAGVFYSASNNIINRGDVISLRKLYNIISNNENFNLNSFIFFLIQRIVLADFFTWKSIDDFERIKYYQIIVELYFDKRII